MAVLAGVGETLLLTITIGETGRGAVLTEVVTAVVLEAGIHVVTAVAVVVGFPLGTITVAERKGRIVLARGVVEAPRKGQLPVVI